MKKEPSPPVLSLLCLICQSLSGKNSIKDFLHQNPQFFGSTASFIIATTPQTPRLQGFIPFHIDHIARHGSRTHDSKKYGSEPVQTNGIKPIL